MLLLFVLFSTAATAAILPIAPIEVNDVDDETDAAYATEDVHHDRNNHLFRPSSIAIFFTRIDQFQFPILIVVHFRCLRNALSS